GSSLQLGPNIVIQGSTGPGPTTSNNILAVTNPGGITQLQSHSVGNQTQILDKNGNAIATFDANKLMNMQGVKQTQTGDTSGTFDIYEFLSGLIKIVIGVQTNFRQNGA